jgi:hypothetical protein
MPLNENHDRLVKAYDSMTRQQWDSFAAWCLANDKATSLESFREYLNREPKG